MSMGDSAGYGSATPHTKCGRALTTHLMLTYPFTEYSVPVAEFRVSQVACANHSKSVLRSGIKIILAGPAGVPAP
jgi:hypothetical protein